MNRYIILIILALSCNNEIEVPYDVTHSLDQPILFADGQIKTLNGICFSSDGRTLYTSNSTDQKFENGRSYAGIFVSNFQNQSWTDPEQLNLGIDAYHPVLSADGLTMYFNSRSHPDSLNKYLTHDIWKISKNENHWGDPEPVVPINSAYYDSYPSVAKSKNIYFNSNRPGGKGGMDIYFSKFENGNYLNPIPLEEVNSNDEENDLVVDPNEQFIIFNRYSNANKTLDLFISFNNDGTWSEPRAIDNINSTKWELTPTLSPEGKYFFFEVDNQIFQVELCFLIYENELPGIGKR